MTNREQREKYAEFARALARQVGEFLLPLSGKTDYREKRPGDVVTKADEEAQSLIFDEIRRHFPETGLLGEENAPNSDWDRGLCWVVDPIDGTRNFIAGLPSFSVSIGLLQDGEPLVGVVHDPFLAETFSAIRGEGTWKNGAQIQKSRTTSLDRSLLVSSFPPKVRPDEPELLRFNRVVQRASMRRLGSAALNLCYVACGRLDGYWASTLNIWDIAAGMLIADEAGCVIQNFQGDRFRIGDAEFCVTATPELAAELLPLLSIG